MIRRTSAKLLRPNRSAAPAAALFAAMVLAACSSVQLGPQSDTDTEEAPAQAEGEAGSADSDTADAGGKDAPAKPAESGDDGTDQPARTGDASDMPELDIDPQGAPVKAEQPGAPADRKHIELNNPGGGERRQTVGLLLPLSGDKAPVGESMLRAAELAMFDIAKPDFNLVVRDTKGTPGGAKAAARSAVDAGANLLLGPVFSSSVKRVAPVAEGGQVPVLAFSNNPEVAEPGTYVLGLMPAQQVRRVVSYAVSQGRVTFAVLAPENAYGQLVVEAMRQAVDRYGGELRHVAFYPPGSQDVSDKVERLAEQGFDEAKNAAVMLPAGGKQLQTLAPTLPFFDIDPDAVQFLGTALWNDPSLGTEPSLVGGWFAAPPPKGRANFRERYRETFASEPHNLASLAYDATALAALLARRNSEAGDPPPAAFTREKLTQRNGFAGVDGVFRLNDDGTVQRLYAILEMQRNDLEVINPAPSRFEPRIN